MTSDRPSLRHGTVQNCLRVGRAMARIWCDWHKNRCFCFNSYRPLTSVSPWAQAQVNPFLKADLLAYTHGPLANPLRFSPSASALNHNKCCARKPALSCICFGVFFAHHKPKKKVINCFLLPHSYHAVREKYTFPYFFILADFGQRAASQLLPFLFAIKIQMFRVSDICLWH